MLKRLRRRFVAISMSIISLVLAAFYVVAGSAVFMSMTLDVKLVLTTFASSNPFENLPEIGKGDEDSSLFALLSGNVCVVDAKELGSITVLEFSRANMDEATASTAVSYVLQQSEDFGHIGSLNLFYYRNNFGFGSRIAFADSTQYFSYLKIMLIDGGAFIIFLLLVFWAIMRFLAQMSLKPVEKAWEQQKNFIADASHELKTPLTVILTNNGIIKNHKEESVESQLQWINSTHEEAVHMRDLVEKLLLLAKTDDMNRKNMFSPVNFSELATGLSLQFEPVAFEKGAFIVTDIDKDVYINGDMLALNQIIHILLDNAVKYSPVGSEITLSLKRRRVYRLKKLIGYDIILSVKNEGEPIPAEDMPHIFERFYRSDKARTTGGGYGLGLAICKNLAALHNADISVASDNNGTVFSVKFSS